MVLVIPGRRQRLSSQRLDPIEIGEEIPLRRFEPLAIASPAFGFLGPPLSVADGALSVSFRQGCMNPFG